MAGKKTIKYPEFFNFIRIKAKPDVDVKSGLKQFTKVVKTLIVQAKNLIPVSYVSKYLGSFQYRYEFIDGFFYCFGNLKPRVNA